jgi:hypothetical protein
VGLLRLFVVALLACSLLLPQTVDAKKKAKTATEKAKDSTAKKTKKLNDKAAESAAKLATEKASQYGEPIGMDKLPPELREKVPQLRPRNPNDPDTDESTQLQFDPAWLVPSVNVTAFGKLKTLKLMLTNLPPGGSLLAGVLSALKPEGHFPTLSAVASRKEFPAVVAMLSLPAAREHFAEGTSGTPGIVLFVRDHAGFGGAALLPRAEGEEEDDDEDDDDDDHASVDGKPPNPITTMAGQGPMSPDHNVEREKRGAAWLTRRRYRGDLESRADLMEFVVRHQLPPLVVIGPDGALGRKAFRGAPFFAHVVLFANLSSSSLYCKVDGADDTLGHAVRGRRAEGAPRQRRARHRRRRARDLRDCAARARRGRRAGGHLGARGLGAATSDLGLGLGSDLGARGLRATSAAPFCCFLKVFLVFADT